jgi:hypothetical protein
MSLFENILDIFFTDEKTEESVELNIKKIIEESKTEETENVEKKEIKVEIDKKEIIKLEKEIEELEKEEEKQEEKEKEEEKEEEKQAEKQEEKQANENVHIDKQTSIQIENLQPSEKSEKKSKDLKEELDDEIKKIKSNNLENLSLKPLQLYIYNDFLELFKNLKVSTLLIINDKEEKRSLKKTLLENDINNIYIISSIKDLKRKITTIPEIKSVVIEGQVFENNTENIIKVINIESKIEYSIYYPVSEYKTVIKTFSKKPVKLITNKATFKKSKFQAIAKKLKISDDDIML